MKERTTISLSPDILDAATRDPTINISAITEKALRARLKPDINAVDPSNILFKCSICSQVVDYIYICPVDFKIYCRKCEELFKCPHNLSEPISIKHGISQREHEHIRLPNFKGELPDNLYKKAKETQYYDGVRELVKKNKKID